MVTSEKILEKLKTIPDPELGISIVDLGLIYGVDIRKGKVIVRMTLTTVGCPLFSLIAEPIKSAIHEFPGIKEVEVDLSFDPPWSPDRMSEEAKIQLGFS